MTQKRIIKKYPNRRLYDTTVSRYITLQDIRQLVIDCIDFQVIDAKTEEELTSSTLLQIILEQEGNNSPLFSRELLEQFIRYYGNSMQSMMSGYLQQSMQFFIDQQNKLQYDMSALFEKTPLNYFNELAKQNMRLWQSLQDNFMHKKSTDIKPETEDKDK